jgi:hypothetical protein
LNCVSVWDHNNIASLERRIRENLGGLGIIATLPLFVAINAENLGAGSFLVIPNYLI